MTGWFPRLDPLLAAAAAQSPDVAQPGYAYVPFLRPLPVWGDHFWPWLLVPLCLGVAVVYKSIKCRSMRQVPKEAVVLTLWILAGMAIAAAALGVVVQATEWANP